MKKSLILVGMGLLLVCISSSCNSDTKTSETEKTAQNAEKSNAMTAAEAVDFVKENDENVGKEVQVSAFCWNRSKNTETVFIDLGDTKLEGLQSPVLTANFKLVNESALKKVKKDTKLTLKGKIMKTPYVYYVEDCELISAE